jgi:hypothetical protein
MGMKGLLAVWTLFWTLALSLAYAQNQRWRSVNDADLREIEGVLLSETRFRHTRNPQEEWKYRARIRYDRGVYEQVSSRSLGTSGDTVALYVSQRDPQLVYVKERLDEKSSAIVFLFGWVFLGLGPWGVALALGFVPKRAAPG